MRAILPGRPQSKRQALTTAHWDGLRLIAYISGNAAIVATGPRSILQTIYIDTVESLIAIAIEETSGRIALCDQRHIYVYDALGRDEGLLRWVQAHDLTRDEGDHFITSLSWSSPDELLVGGSRLLLWDIPESNRPRVIWEQSLPYPTALAYLSSDGGLIASCGQHDRLVKIWRRLSYEVDSTRFDVSYLSHPAAVTNLHWRKPWHAEQSLDNLLYSFCADNHVRVWTHSDHHALSVMQFVAEIDMNASIQPRRLSVGSVSQRRYAFVIDSRDFSQATEKAVQNASGESTDHALEHLIEIANRSPEICIVLDGVGHMSAWGLENAGYKNKNAPVLFNVAHVDGMEIPLPTQRDSTDYTQFCIFAGGSTKSSLSLLVHSFAGSINWYDSQITRLFDTSVRKDRVQLLSSWTGHDDPIEKIVRDPSGQYICSWTDDGKAIFWDHKADQNAAPLLQRSSYENEEDIVDAILSDDGCWIVLLQPNSVMVFKSENGRASVKASSHLTGQKDSFRLMQIGPSFQRPSSIAFGIIYNDHSIEMWSVDLPATSHGDTRSNGVQPRIRLLSNISIRLDGDRRVVFPCSHVQAGPCTPTLPVRCGYAAVALSREGVLNALTHSWDEKQDKHELLPSEAVPTNIHKPALATAVSSGKVALIDSTKTMLTIWDLSSGICELALDFKGLDTIEKLSWTGTAKGNLLVAVCFAFKILVVGQKRFSEPLQEEAWTELRTIRLRDFTTLAIRDVCCLGNGDILVGAGNQLFVLDSAIPQLPESDKALQGLSKKVEKLFAKDFIDAINTILPVFHADLLNLFVGLGKTHLFIELLLSLHRKLKYFSEGDLLPSTLDVEVEDLVLRVSNSPPRSDRRVQNDKNEPNGINHNDQFEKTFSIDIATRMHENLDKYRLPMMTTQEQKRLSKTITVAVELDAHKKSLDENALRYLCALHSHDEGDLPWSAIMFATMSTSHEILVNIVTQFYGGKLTWDAARRSGMFLWLSDPEALRVQMENVARAEYTRHEDRNPVDCSLYYFALGKKSVLQGLWRMTVGVREKENTMKLLANNFNDPRWKATALKNAYALLSKRRFEYGAAFFLLAGSLKDAVNVCAHQLHDLQLAIAVARVNDKEGETALRILIERTILPAAVNSDQGRWMASWAFTMLDQRDKAIQAVVRPVHQVVGVPLSGIQGVPGSLSYRANDPILTVLFLQLRAQLYKKNQWVDVISPKEEWDFVIRNVRHYQRMGCDILALALVRSWEFLPALSKARPGSADGLSSDGAAVEGVPMVQSEIIKPQEEVEKKKKPPTQFQEPSSSSLLDSFGF